MALPTIIDVKRYLRVQTTAEDTLLTALLASATQLVEAYLGRPILTVAARAMTDEGKTLTAYGVVTKLLVPVTPYDAATLAITDADGTALTLTTDYRVGDPWTGEVFAAVGTSFPNGPYTLTADVGLETASDYATRIEPVLFVCILDVVADLWHRRNPAASTESTGGGVSTTYTAEGIPARTAAMLAPFRVVRWA